MDWCNTGSCLSGTGLAASTIANALQFFASMQCLIEPPAPTYKRLPNGTSVDFIIVGGGTAGCAIAARLAEANFSVLVLEAGSKPPVESYVQNFARSLRGSKYDWNFTVASDSFPHNELAHRQKLVIAKLLGGIAAMSGSIYSRGSPDDFNAWADVLGDDTWNYTNLLPYFKKTEKLEDLNVIDYLLSKKYHGFDGEITVSGVELSSCNKQFLKSFTEIGFKTVHDYNNPEVRGAGPLSFMMKDGKRQNSLTALLNKVAHKHNVYVMTEALVTKILFNDKTAYGVKVMLADQEHEFYANKEVIVSAGVYNTPKLLMLSGIGPKYHLDEIGIELIEDLPVGENHQDHLTFVTYLGAENGTCWRDQASKHMEVLKFLYDGSGSLGVPSSLAVDYTLKNSKHPYVPDITILPGCVELNGDYYNFCKDIVQYPSEICARLDELNIFYELMPVEMILRLPKFKGKVLLKSNRYEDKPVIHTGALSNPEDLEDYIEALDVVWSLVNTTYFKSKSAFVVDLKLPNCAGLQGEEHTRCIVKSLTRTTSHGVGTAAMGKVLDSKLNVLGVKGLRVIDASAIPVETRGGTIAPVLVVVEKAAEFIKNEYKSQLHLP